MYNTQVAAQLMHTKTTGYGGKVEIKMGTSIPKGFECPKRLVAALLDAPQKQSQEGHLFWQDSIPAGQTFDALGVNHRFGCLNLIETMRILAIPPAVRRFLCLICFEGCAYVATFERKKGNAITYGISLQTLTEIGITKAVFQEETVFLYLGMTAIH
ncbi:MAG: hypothetical protein RI996_398 [Candidatus Parcubacteria bacterium]|jgi:hypothetical protein